MLGSFPHPAVASLCAGREIPVELDARPPPRLPAHAVGTRKCNGVLANHLFPSPFVMHFPFAAHSTRLDKLPFYVDPTRGRLTAISCGGGEFVQLLRKQASTSRTTLSNAQLLVVPSVCGS
jgi:hypothetical protein